MKEADERMETTAMSVMAELGVRFEELYVEIIKTWACATLLCGRRFEQSPRP